MEEDQSDSHVWWTESEEPLELNKWRGWCSAFLREVEAGDKHCKTPCRIHKVVGFNTISGRET